MCAKKMGPVAFVTGFFPGGGRDRLVDFYLFLPLSPPFPVPLGFSSHFS